MIVDETIIKDMNLSKHKSHYFLLTLIVLLGISIYSQSLKAGFLWDDEMLIKDNIYIKHASNLGKIFTQKIGAGTGEKYPFYRPLLLLSLMVDYHLWGLNPVGYHLETILFHVFAALCLYWFIFTLFKKKILSFLVSLFFMIHPIQVEDVAYITGRSDSLMLSFLLIAFIFYLKVQQKASLGNYFIALFSLIAALFFKENAVVFPLLLLLYHFIFKKKIKQEVFYPIGFTVGAYCLLRVFFMLPSISKSKIAIVSRIPGFFAALSGYAKNLLFPVNLHMGYSNNLFSFKDQQVLLGTAVFFILLFFFGRYRVKKPIIAFSIGWFFISLIPVSNILYPASSYMANRYLYLPSIGCFLLLGLFIVFLFNKGASFRVLSIVLSLFCFGFFSWSTVKHSLYWSNPIVFYTHSLKYAKNNEIMHNNLGNAYREAGQYDKAINSYLKAIEINPNRDQTYNNLGVVYKEIGALEKAISVYKKALEINPLNPKIYNNLGLIFYSAGNNKDAEDLFMRSLKVRDNYPTAYHNLGIVYSRLGKKEKAVEFFEKAINLDPDNIVSYAVLANEYNSLGLNNKAIAVYKAAIKRAPSQLELHNNLGLIYRSIGDFSSAIEAYKRALRINPEQSEVYNNLGVAYADIGQIDLAINAYQKALEINPEYKKIYNNLGVLFHKNKQLEKAIESFKKAIEFDENYGRAYENLGTVFREAGKKKEAIAWLKTGIKKNPQNAGLYNLLGLLQYEQGLDNEAVVNYKKAIAINAENGDYYNNLAVLYFKNGEQELGVDILKQAVQKGLVVPEAVLEALKGNK